MNRKGKLGTAHTCRSNTQRPHNPLNLLPVHKTRVRRVPGIQLPLLQPPAHVLASEAVPDTAQLLDTQVAAQVLEDGLDDGVDLWNARHLFVDPLHDVEICGRVERYYVAVEKVGNNGEVPIRGKLVGDAGTGG